MKQNLSLGELEQVVSEHQRNKRDFVVPTNALECLETGDIMFGLNGKPFITKPTHPALRQIGEHCGIPAKYFDRMMAEAPQLMAQNVNHWFQNKPSTQMVRTLDNNLRGFLSKKYRPLDNADCINAAIPVIEQFRGQIESCALTDTRMYLKVVIPDREIELKADGVKWGVGHNPIHLLRPGLVITNSETGHGAVSIQPGVHERHCSNLMVMNSAAMRKLHVQKGVDSQEHANEYLTDETRAAADLAFWMTVRDLIRASLDGRIFEDYVNQIRETMGQVIQKPQAVVELVADRYNLTNDERDAIMNRLANSGEPTRFGLQAAITSAAQEVESYDRSTELERLGGTIIELPKKDWAVLAEAA